MSGLSRILSFPFRMYGLPFLPMLEGQTADRAHKVRIHPPILVRPEGMPLSPDVPFPSWPNFEWSPDASDRFPPPKVAPRPGLGPRMYDSLRVDFWGKDPNNFATRFEPMFLSWVRAVTGQEWIGEYEPHTDVHVKYQFGIDSEGRASEAPYAVGRAMTPSKYMHPLTPELWESAFAQSLLGQSPPLYWMIWQDAGLHRSANRMRESCLSLTLSLELARDTLFPRFAKTRSRPGVGAVLIAPFDGTDLLRHLSSALYDVLSRNFQTEEPVIWNHIKELYVARHHVAHGREAIVRDARGTRSVSDKDLLRWKHAVQDCLLWMEKL